MSKVCITGGAGFIGSHLVDHCLEMGHEVEVIDNFSTGTYRNLRKAEDDIVIHEIDIRDSEQLVNVLTDVDVIFHQAALPSVPRSLEVPIESTDITLMGTVIMMEEAHKAGVDQFIYASSSSVYGDKDTLPKVENMRPDPQSPYAASKVGCENFANVFDENFSLNTIGLRYFNVFGPRQDPTSDYAAVIPNFIRAILSGHSPVIYGDGEQSRDFTFVHDVVDANLEVALRGRPGKVYNVGYNQQLSINQLLEYLLDITGKSIEPVYEAPRPGDVRHSRADVTELVEDTEFVSDRNIKKALAKTVEWFRNHPDRWEEPNYEN